MVRPNDRFKKNPDILHRRMKKESVLLPVHPRKETSRRLYFLEGVGDRIWELLDGRRDCSRIITQIAWECKVKEERVEGEVRYFLSDMVKEGLIRRLS